MTGDVQLHKHSYKAVGFYNHSTSGTKSGSTPQNCSRRTGNHNSRPEQSSWTKICRIKVLMKSRIQWKRTTARTVGVKIPLHLLQGTWGAEVEDKRAFCDELQGAGEYLDACATFFLVDLDTKVGVLLQGKWINNYGQTRKYWKTIKRRWNADRSVRKEQCSYLRYHISA